MTREDLPDAGRKYTLTKAGLGMICLGQAACFALAVIGKLTADFVTASTIFFGSVAGLVSAFNAANAYTTGKAADAGLSR